AWLQQWGKEQTPDSIPPTPDETIQELIDQKVSLKIQEHKRERQLEPQTLPPDADNLVGLLHALILRCLNVSQFDSLLAVERLKPPRSGQRPPPDLMRRQRRGQAGEFRSGVLCLVVSNRTSMTALLRRLAQDTQPPQRLVLVTEERRPLDPAAAGKEYLEQIRQRHQTGFQHIHMTFDEYAELDSLQGVVGLARSGDLEIALPGGLSRRVNEQEGMEVIDWHHRRQRYLAHPLLHLLLEGEPPSGRLAETPPMDKNWFVPDSQDLRQFIMARLAITMGASSQEMAVKYQEYLQHKEL